MDAQRALALHRFYAATRSAVKAFYAGRQEPTHWHAANAARVECDAAGVSWEERDALLAMAGYPFASDWSRERYGAR